MDGYWSYVLRRRINRRRALAMTGSTALAASLLAACGGGSSSGGSSGGASGDKSGLLSVPQDTSAQAVQGGTWQTRSDSDPSPSIDVHKVATVPAGRATDFYDFLLKYTKGQGGRNGPIAGEAAESWEFSPDGLTLNMELRPNHSFDPRPPTNGRAMTTQDVKFSWDRFLMYSPQAADLKPTNPTSPIASLNATDASTITVKLNFPFLSTLDIFAYQQYMMIMPTEAEGGYDPRTETRGAGPYYLDKWTQSVNLVWKRNPNWYEKGVPYLDGLVETIIPDAASALAQFEAGNIWDGGSPSPYQQDDVLRLKHDHPAMVLHQTFPMLGGDYLYAMSRQPGNIFNDVRARQAASMLIDRDLFLQAFLSTDTFTTAGLPVIANWNSHIPNENPEWLDPKTNQLGDGSKYFQHNVADAKKLLSAAGYNGESLDLSFSNLQNAREYDILQGMWKDGINFNINVLPYDPTWRQVCQTSQGMGYNGICYSPGTGFNAEEHIVRWYTPEGRYSYTKDETPVLTDLARQIRSELDKQKQTDLIKEFQRQAAPIMALIPSIGTATGFSLNWPWLQNIGVWTGFPSVHLKAYYWYDKTKDTKTS